MGIIKVGKVTQSTKRETDPNLIILMTVTAPYQENLPTNIFSRTLKLLIPNLNPTHAHACSGGGGDGLGV